MVRRLTALVLTVAAATSSPAWAARKKAVDTTPPRIEHTPPAACTLEAACVIEARITDDSGVFDPTLLFRAAGASTFERTPMQAVPGDATLFRATLPAALVASGDVEYLVEAFDVQGNGPARAGTDAAPLRVGRSTTPSTTTTTNPTTTPTANPTTNPSATATTTPTDEGNGLTVGLIVGGAVLAVAVGGGIAFALYALRPTGPDVVTVTIAAPSPVPSALLAGGAR
jgi:hypothetical protein